MFVVQKAAEITLAARSVSPLDIAAQGDRLLDLDVEQARDQRDQVALVLVDRFIGVADFPEQTHYVHPPGPVEVAVQDARELVHVDRVRLAPFRLRDQFVDLIIAEPVVPGEDLSELRGLGR